MNKQKENKMQKWQLFLLIALHVMTLGILSKITKMFTRTEAKIVLIQNGFVGVDIDNNNVPDIKVKITDVQFMMITSANLDYDLPVVLNQKNEILELNFTTHPLSAISPEALRKHKETFFWKR
jgi:hypothetical protein